VVDETVRQPEQQHAPLEAHVGERLAHRAARAAHHLMLLDGDQQLVGFGEPAQQLEVERLDEAHVGDRRVELDGGFERRPQHRAEGEYRDVPPLAAQLAMYLGYVRGGVPGASIVAVLFVLPSFLMVWALSFAYVRFGGLSFMQALFYGIEYRWNLTDERTPFNIYVAKGVRTGIQLAAFWERGTVADHSSELFKDGRSSYGIGARLVLSGVVIRFDLARGNEGVQTQLFITYPWSMFSVDNPG